MIQGEKNTMRGIVAGVEYGGSVKKSNYKTVTEIIITIIAIGFMKTENWRLGAVLLLLTVVYDIIVIIKNSN